MEEFNPIGEVLRWMLSLGFLGSTLEKADRVLGYRNDRLTLHNLAQPPFCGKISMLVKGIAIKSSEISLFLPSLI
jgi:hypothetical protein